MNPRQPAFLQGVNSAMFLSKDEMFYKESPCPYPFKTSLKGHWGIFYWRYGYEKVFYQRIGYGRTSR